MDSSICVDSKDICFNMQKIPFTIACRNAGLNDEQIKPLLDDPRNSHLIRNGFVDQSIDSSEYYLKGCDNFFNEIHKRDLFIPESGKIVEIVCDVENPEATALILQNSSAIRRCSGANIRVKDPFLEEVNKSIYGDEYKSFDPKSKLFHKSAEEYCLYRNYANSDKVEDAIFDIKAIYIYPNETTNKVFSQYHIEKLNEIIRQNEIANQLMFENSTLKLNENKKILQRSTSEPCGALETSQIITSKLTTSNINLKSVNMKMQYIMQPPFHPHEPPGFAPILQGPQLQFSVPIYQQSAIPYYHSFQSNGVLRPFDSITSLSLDASITTATSSTKTKIEKNSKENKKLYSKIVHP